MTLIKNAKVKKPERETEAGEAEFERAISISKDAGDTVVSGRGQKKEQSFMHGPTTSGHRNNTATSSAFSIAYGCISL